MKNRLYYFLVAACLWSLPFLLFGQQVFPGGGLGSYNLTYPPEICPDPGACNFDLYNLVGGGNVAAMSKGSTYPGPFQTHNWWNSSLWNVATPACVGDITTTVNMHSDVMRPFPVVHLESKPNGQVIRHRELALNGGGPNNTGSFFADEDITIGMVNAGANEFYSCPRTDVMDYGDMHVTLRQDFGSGNSLQMTASSGCPFMYFQKEGTAEAGVLLFFLRATAVSSSGNSVTIHRSINYGDYHQRYYSLFFPPGTTISGDDGATYIPIASIPHNGTTEWGGNNRYFRIRLPAGVNYFTVAVPPDTTQATLDLYEQHAFNFITDTRFTYAYNEATATLTNTYTTTTVNVLGGANTGPLLAQYLHQYTHSPEHPGNFTGRSYRSARGTMRVCTGNVFTTVMKNYGFLPALGWANTADQAQLNTFVSNYAARGYSNVDCGTPVYGAFGSLHEAARIAEIAHAVGNIAARDKLLDIAKQGIQTWLTAPNGEYYGMYYYDRDFNWLTPFPSAFDADRLLQDSHFHHGYLVYAAAIVARFEPDNTWATQWGPMIELVIRNINDYQRNMTPPPGGPDAPWFPYLRYFDPYAGHSWAGHDASNQESVSESINFAAGCALWGETVGNTVIRDMGIMLYVQETEAARTYWWDGARIGVNRNPFALNYNHYHAGILGRDGVAYATFFGADPHYIHGITYVPITGSSLWMGVDAVGAANQQDDFQTAFGGPTNGSGGFWSTVMLMQQAVYDAATAKNRFLTEAVPGGWGGNDYRVDGLYWISTFDSVGVVDPTVQANVASFAVFRKATCKHYMIYNARGKGTRTVTFSDGEAFVVPDDTIITFKVCSTPLPVTLLEFSGRREHEGVVLQWVTTDEQHTAYFGVERSCDGIHFEKIGRVQAAVYSSAKEYYRFTDEDPCPGISYYRLKQADQDQSYAYSRIIMVSETGAVSGNVFLYPNPSSGEVKISVHSGDRQWMEVTIYDLLGKELLAEEFLAGAGETVTTFDLSEFASGNYTIIVTEKQEGISTRIRWVKF